MWLNVLGTKSFHFQQSISKQKDICQHVFIYLQHLFTGIIMSARELHQKVNQRNKDIQQKTLSLCVT